jgi:hypothetical protein
LWPVTACLAAVGLFSTAASPRFPDVILGDTPGGPIDTSQESPPLHNVSTFRQFHLKIR